MECQAAGPSAGRSTESARHIAAHDGQQAHSEGPARQSDRPDSTSGKVGGLAVLVVSARHGSINEDPSNALRAPDRSSHSGASVRTWYSADSQPSTPAPGKLPSLHRGESRTASIRADASIMLNDGGRRPTCASPREVGASGCSRGGAAVACRPYEQQPPTGRQAGRQAGRWGAHLSASSCLMTALTRPQMADSMP